MLGYKSVRCAVAQLVNTHDVVKHNVKLSSVCVRMENEQSDSNRCSSSARADYMLFELSQNMHQLRFVVAAQNMQLPPFYQQEYLKP